MKPSNHLRQMARRCSLRYEVLGAIGYGVFLLTTVGIAWWLGGVWSAGVVFFIAAGLAFLYMDVDGLPSDDECERFNGSHRL